MSKQFWYSAMIRAIRTVCQTAIATIGTAMVLTDVDWRMVASASVLAGILSILTSVATGLPEVSEPDELTDEEVFISHDVEMGDDDEEAR